MWMLVSTQYSEGDVTTTPITSSAMGTSMCQEKNRMDKQRIVTVCEDMNNIVNQIQITGTGIFNMYCTMMCSTVLYCTVLYRLQGRNIQSQFLPTQILISILKYLLLSQIFGPVIKKVRKVICQMLRNFQLIGLVICNKYFIFLWFVG